MKKISFVSTTIAPKVFGHNGLGHKNYILSNFSKTKPNADLN